MFFHQVILDELVFPLRMFFNKLGILVFGMILELAFPKPVEPIETTKLVR